MAKRRVARFDLVIFDLDGTLVDSLPDITRALNLARAEVGFAPLGSDVVRGLVGEGVVRLVEKALAYESTRPYDIETVTAVAERVRSIYKSEPCVETRLYPGIADLLSQLRADKRRLALLTNKPGEVMRPLLEALGLDAALDAAIGDGDGHPRKPDPGAVVALMQKFGVPRERTLMVGDGLPDMAVAQAAKIASAAALWGYTSPEELAATHPTFTVARAADLFALI